MAAKRGAVRACDSLCVFARVLRVTLFFFILQCACVIVMCVSGGCVKGRMGGSLTQDV